MARRRMTAALAIGVTMAVLAATQCGGGSSTRPTPPVSTDPPGTIPPNPNPTPIPSAPQTFVSAGDIAWCTENGARLTGQLIQTINGQVFTAGDNAYMDGSLKNYMDCYEPTWGRVKDRTRPVAGNHEYDTDPSANGYYSYFGAFSGPPPGFYSYEVGDWHIIALNSALPQSGFGAGSAQLRWLQADLASSNKKCTLAVWHHPLFTSGPNGPNLYTRDAWRMLYDANVDVIVNGHDHLYERFAPQDPDGRPDPARGIRQFIVGTGGAVLYSQARVTPNSERLITMTWGILKFTLSTGSYEWQFIPVQGSSASDAGRGDCH